MNLQEAKKRVLELLATAVEPDYTIRDFNFATVMIYGAGGNGKLIYKLLKYLEVNVVAFLDRGAKPNQKLYGGGGFPFITPMQILSLAICGKYQ